MKANLWWKIILFEMVFTVLFSTNLFAANWSGPYTLNLLGVYSAALSFHEFFADEDTSAINATEGCPQGTVGFRLSNDSTQQTNQVLAGVLAAIMTGTQVKVLTDGCAQGRAAVIGIQVIP